MEQSFYTSLLPSLVPFLAFLLGFVLGGFGTLGFRVLAALAARWVGGNGG